MGKGADTWHEGLPTERNGHVTLVQTGSNFELKK